jgi:hypothetical protein
MTILGEIGADDGAYDAVLELVDRMLRSVPFPPGARAEVEATTGIYRDGLEPEYGPLPRVPTAVLLAGRLDPPSPQQVALEGGAWPWDREAYDRADLRSRAERLQEWVLSAPGGLFAVTMSSGHAIQDEEPDLVVHAIRTVLRGWVEAEEDGRRMRHAFGSRSTGAPASWPCRRPSSVAFMAFIAHWPLF